MSAAIGNLVSLTTRRTSIGAAPFVFHLPSAAPIFSDEARRYYTIYRGSTEYKPDAALPNGIRTNGMPLPKDATADAIRQEAIRHIGSPSSAGSKTISFTTNWRFACEAAGPNGGVIVTDTDWLDEQGIRHLDAYGKGLSSDRERETSVFDPVPRALIEGPYPPDPNRPPQGKDRKAT